ncbi:MAG TPA: LLM class flavin-dependent oxidoreductase [Ktedonobacteraceae bacterium]|nr:LLM class flavin-dependent oxidoreductase [Ktedonobacteraceae bacterium]
MQIAIGLPGTIPGVSGEFILDWAKLAEVGPFSSFAVLDRLVYPNYEPLITLAAVAGVTERMRLMTSILIAPLHDTAILAKQAASIDALSNGRLTLGIAVGGRQDDYQAAQVPFHERGKRFDEQLATMKRIWSGQPVSDKVGAIGPNPVQKGGPELLIGGYSPEAIKRVGRWGDGFISGGGGPDAARQGYNVAEQSWKEAGRPGKPRFVGATYYGLGQDAAEKAAQYIRHYYSFMGPMADRIAASVPSTPEAIKGALKAFADVGVDELIFWPTIADLNQVDMLAELVS